jgi:SAM-dependent methyltransferase
METIDGYVNDVPYMDNVWSDHAPGHLRFKALAHGAGAPDIDRFAYLDLGCGTGLGTTVYAALYPNAQFVGIDASPAHIARAQTFARDVGVTNVRFIESSFQDMLARPPADLPLFDFVVLHGVYSWIDEPNRQAVRRLLRKVCASGAIVYVSYNALPGNGAMLACQRLVRYAGSLVPGTSLEKVAKAQDAVTTWIGRGQGFFKEHPLVLKHLDAMRSRSLPYQAHELLNEAWVPFMVTEVAADMAQEGFSFIGSAMNTMPPLKEAALEEVQERDQRLLNELARDFARNTSFRSDLYLAPARNPFDAARSGDIDEEWVCSLTGLADFLKPVPEHLLTPKTRAVLERWWTTLRSGPATIGSLKADSDLDDDPAILIWFMIDSLGLVPCREKPSGVEEARRINRAVLQQPPFGSRGNAMAVPLTGASFTITLPVAISWLVEQAEPGLDAISHARAMGLLLDQRQEKLDDAGLDEVERQNALFGHANRHVSSGCDRMRLAGLL